MTENEAIEWLAEETSPTLIHIAEMKKENPMEYINEAVKVACHALEEIQQYRAIGTVEELQTMKENGAFTGAELAQLACMQMKLKRYTEIGTIEEFKDLKENERKCEECAGCTEWLCDCANVRAKTIDEMQDNLIRNSWTEVIDGEICLIVTDKRIKQIAEQMKGGE